MEPRHERGFDFEGTLKWQPILEPKKEENKSCNSCHKKRIYVFDRKER